MVAGLVLLVLAGGSIAWLAASDGDDDGRSADPPASSSVARTTTDAPAESEEPATPSSAEEEPTPPDGSPSSTSEPPQAPDPATEVRATLEQYYALLPGDTESAYALTGPSLRSQVSYGSYSGFFGTWSEVSLLDVRNVSVQGDRITATTDVEFTRPGERQVETHAVTFVRGDDGSLLVDLDVAV